MFFRSFSRIFFPSIYFYNCTRLFYLFICCVIFFFEYSVDGVGYVRMANAQEAATVVSKLHDSTPVGGLCKLIVKVFFVLRLSFNVFLVLLLIRLRSVRFFVFLFNHFLRIFFFYE